MAHRRRPALARSLAVLLLLSCASSSPDLTSPPTGNPPPQEPPTQPPTPPPTPEPPPPPTEPPPAPPPGPPIPNPPGLGAGARILFIGNSLTDGNDVPGLVRSLASAAGLGWHIEAQLLGGASLQDHWDRGAARTRIQSGHWDAVVLQQGPSSLPESRLNLRQWVGEFDGLIRAAGGRAALYMVWPERARLAFFDRVRDSYALAARDVGGYFLPAGETWRAAWRVESGLALYGGDGFHPTMAGSYAAALTIFAGLSGLPPAGPVPVGLTPQTAERLRQATQEALDEYGDYAPGNAP